MQNMVSSQSKIIVVSYGLGFSRGVNQILSYVSLLKNPFLIWSDVFLKFILDGYCYCKEALDTKESSLSTKSYGCIPKSMTISGRSSSFLSIMSIILDWFSCWSRIGESLNVIDFGNISWGYFDRDSKY